MPVKKENVRVIPVQKPHKEVQSIKISPQKALDMVKKGC